MTNFTPEQLAFAEACIKPSSNLQLNAVAGSGKTTTIAHANKLIVNADSSNSILNVAFNKRIAEEFKSRMPSSSANFTFNGLGSRALSKRFRAKVDFKKRTNCVKHALKPFPKSKLPANIFQIISAGYNLAKQLGYAPKLDVKKYNLTPLSTDVLSVDKEYAAIIDAAISESNRQAFEEGKVDFDDQIYLSVLLRLRAQTFTHVFVDECQDMNSIQRAMVKLHLAAFGKGKLFAVGDPYQAIYGFRGADDDSYQQISTDFGTTEFPLTYTFRCAKKIVLEAQDIVPHIKAPDSAPDGTVTETDYLNYENISPGSAVICRYNAPLLKAAFNFIKHRRATTFIGGRDIQQQINGVIDVLQSSSLPLDSAIESYINDQADRAERLRAPRLLETAHDTIACIRTLLESGDLSYAKTVLEDIMSQTGNVELSTIHKAKGLEWPSVYALTFGDIDLDRPQEPNCLYVGITRAETSLTYVGAA